MTTLELIERGIGHNCLSDAYDLGRADAIQEQKEFWEMQNNMAYEQGRADKYQEIVSEYMLLTEKQVAEIRADAIDECIKTVTDYCGGLPNNNLINELEKLKEQK